MGPSKHLLILTLVFIQSSLSQFQDRRFNSGSCKNLLGETRQSSGASGGAKWKDEGILRVGDSYWVPYSDRTVAAMSFPSDTAEDSSIPVGVRGAGRYGRRKRSPYGWGEDPGTKKPKSSNFGVVVSRNSLFKRNFRDYAKLSVFEGDCRSPEELVFDLAKGLLRSQLSTRNGQSFVVVAFESRVKTPSGDDFSRRRSNSDQVSHNGTSGTIIFPRVKNPDGLATIQFFIPNLEDLEANYRGFGGAGGNSEEAQINLFVKMLAGIHKDTIKDGRNAMRRFQRRSAKLRRPSFGVSVEETTADRRNDSEDRRRREEIARDERDFREDAWFSTTSIGIRTISSS